LIFLVSIQAYVYLLSSVLTSLGHVKIIAVINWILVAILLPVLIYAAIYKGLEDLVLYRTFLAFSFLLIFSATTYIKTQFDLRPLAFAFLRPFVAVFVMYFSMIVVKGYLQEHSDIIAMIIVVSCAIFAYVTALLTIWIISGRKIGGEEYILDKILQILLKFEKLKSVTRVMRFLVKS
jgi:hypothetical protein